MPVAVWILCACLAWAASLSAAVAQPSSGGPTQQRPLAEAITVSPGATCLRLQSVEGHVRMWLRRDQVASDLEVRVRGDSSDPYKAEFELVKGGTTRTRRFDRAPQSCDELHAALGLAIALAIDMAALDDLVEVAAPPPRTAPSWLVSFLIGFGQELLPGAALAGEVGVELTPLPILQLRLDVLVQHAFDARIPGSQGRLQASLLAAGLAVCMGGRLASRLSASLCAGPLGGEVFARGRDYEPNYRGRQGLFGIRSGGRLVVTAGIAWVLDVDVVAPVRAPTYEAAVDGGDALLRDPSSAAFSVLLGPAVRF